MKKLLVLMTMLLSIPAMAQDVTPDLALYNLKGKVKSMKQGENTYSFSEEGKWIEINGEDIYDHYEGVRKNRAKQVIEITWNETGAQPTQQVMWNTDGTPRLKTTVYPQGVQNIHISYNEQGFISKEEYKIDSPSRGGLGGNKTITYTYNEIDNYGNWTSRTASVGGKSTTETRTIEYYE